MRGDRYKILHLIIILNLDVLSPKTTDSSGGDRDSIDDEQFIRMQLRRKIQEDSS